MPEFQRRWKDWTTENLSATGQYDPDETDESPFDSFVRPIPEPSAEEIPGKSHETPESCLVPACQFSGDLVDLGGGLITRLCAPHRRELFGRARHLLEAGEDPGSYFAQRLCRFCGRPTSPEDEPCRQCAATRSPLLQLALTLGAQPICPRCGTRCQVLDLCSQCRQDLWEDAR